MAAAQRLAVLRRHLESVPEIEIVERNETRAMGFQVGRPLPGGGPGKVTIKDHRTGKEYTMEVSDHGTIRAMDLKKITAGGDGVGLRVYDNGYTNTTACRSSISYIDGSAGILRYRGYPIEQLAERATFLETAYLCIYGELPALGELERWSFEIARHSALPEAVERAVSELPHDAHPMGTILTGLSALSCLHNEQNPALAGQGIYKSPNVQDKQIVRLIAKIPTLAALAYHRASGRVVAAPNQSLGYVENFLFMIDAGPDRNYRPNPRLVRALEILFITHAEHELNCSTSAARHLASSGVDVYTAMAGAIGALYGPQHGGANEAVLRMLQRIGSVENVPAFLAGVKAKKELLFGFGHRVYKARDPRVAIIRKTAEQVFAICGDDPLVNVAAALENAARADEYFVKRNLYANVDFYSGLVYRAMGFLPQFFTVLFALPRMTGYLAHWRESLTDPDSKIVRPQQDYRGVWLRDYVEVRQRNANTMLGPVPASNAYRRKAAGTGKELESHAARKLDL